MSRNHTFRSFRTLILVNFKSNWWQNPKCAFHLNHEEIINTLKWKLAHINRNHGKTRELYHLLYHASMHQLTKCTFVLLLESLETKLHILYTIYMYVYIYIYIYIYYIYINIYNYYIYITLYIYKIYIYIYIYSTSKAKLLNTLIEISCAWKPSFFELGISSGKYLLGIRNPVDHLPALLLK